VQENFCCGELFHVFRWCWTNDDNCDDTFMGHWSEGSHLSHKRCGWFLHKLLYCFTCTFTLPRVKRAKYLLSRNHRASPYFGRYVFSVLLRIGSWVPGRLVIYQHSMPVNWTDSPVSVHSTRLVHIFSVRPDCHQNEFERFLHLDFY